MDPSIFAEILSSISEVCPGFEAAVFYDHEGEAIDYFSFLDPFDTRLIAAHLGVLASSFTRSADKLNLKDIHIIEISSEKKDSITVLMGDNLFISVMVKAGFLNRTIHRKIKNIILKIKEEIAG
jgi:predicted regulator of Ras-like GTPase activity (Roadblock/LC7/MglB family)